MNIVAVTPHGFCAGVTAALARAHAVADDARGATVWCLHEIVHNELVVAELRRRNFVFVDDITDVPVGSTVLFSAHGVSPAVRAEAAERRLRIIDATCPFVDRVHRAARDFAARGLPVIVIGNPAHAEVRGIVGEVLAHGGAVRVVRSVSEVTEPEPALPPFPLAVVCQTTMNADDVGEIVAALRAHGPIEAMAEVCRATKVRQDAVRAFRGDALLVLGSGTSSNTRRLVEISPCRAFRAGTLAEIDAIDFSGIGTLGVTSGASTPEAFYDAALARVAAASATR